MTTKTKGPGGQPGPGYNGEQNLTIDSLIVAELPQNCQKLNLDELDTSLDICSDWLAHLFASDDPADETRLADVWDEYLRQRQMWSGVGR